MTNVSYESITGHPSPIKHHIPSKINKQVYQAGSNSSFQETPDPFLPWATGLPGKRVNTVNSAWALRPAVGQCAERKKTTSIFLNGCPFTSQLCRVLNKLFYYVCQAESSSTLNKIVESSVQDVHSIIKLERRKWLHIHQLSQCICYEIIVSWLKVQTKMFDHPN